MAKKKSTSSKKTPAVRYLRYELTNSGSAGTETSHYIDLARDLSAINRRLYRQGRDYYVRKVTVISSNTPNLANRISISTLPDSYSVRNAWKRGFQHWKRQRDEVSKDTGILPGKFNDFKVHLSDDSRTATKLVPKDNGGNNLVLGEWIYAQLVTPDGTTSADGFELHMLGDHNGAAGSRVSVGLVKSYAESRATVQSVGDPYQPSTTADDPIVNIFDAGTHHDEVIEKIEDDNDLPPYDVGVDYAGSSGNHPKPLVVQDTTLMEGKAVMGGFNAVAGLLEIEATSPIANDVYSVLVELAPGNYRGISADVI